MAEKTMSQRMRNAAHHIKAIKDIIAAFLKGGWVAAGVQAIRHYWPVILSLALVLVLLLPLILFFALPMIFFGFPGSTDNEIITMNNRALEVSSYFDDYEEEYNSALGKVREIVQGFVKNGYILSEVGEPLTKNWFIALFMVSIENDLNSASKDKVLKLIAMCVVYEIAEAATTGSPGKIVLRLLSPVEIMEKLLFNEEECEWAELLHDTLEEGV